MAEQHGQQTTGRRRAPDSSAPTVLWEKSAAEHRAVLEKIKGGLATKVRILANQDCCPVCNAVEGAYDFDAVPALPVEGCSHPLGCRCHYAPVLDRFGP